MIPRLSIPLSANCLAISLPLVIPASAPGQPKPGNAMIEQYLAQETAKISQPFLDGATTLQEWQVRRPRLRKHALSGEIPE